ncbi:ribonuclease D [Motilibacter peucedani]|uniref:Ribonuclease D n=1 Tax=Motilibacter peucedani TaxID=598650 RepID=A0A420XS75_9ACTN|nr:ribonuclease D [Motilibacter peucedani]RKS77649.1 ribonuclease D [Motilibacter peucedani]
MSEEPVVEPETGPPAPVLETREPVPEPVATRAAFEDAVARLAAGTGPVAIDAERASGYRYSARAYLVQLRRAGAGTVLVDPIGLGGMAALGEALQDAEWVLHAASQDLPCLAEEGMHPGTLFDTELAGRLLGMPRVGLQAMVLDLLGYHLEKGYSAADWSTRPLPEPWLRYAALDVEVLVELRDALEQRLADAGKLEWAREEFAALATPRAPLVRAEPWRRTSGLHRVRKRRQLAVVRELWTTRDEVARDRDIAPGRVLPDAAIVEAALASPRSVEELVALPLFGGRGTRRRAGQWAGAVRRALALDEDALPSAGAPLDGPPPARAWADRDPAAADRLTFARTAMGAIAAEHSMPVENLLTPDTVRRLAWDPPVPLTVEAVAEFARAHGAREWQVGLTAAALTDALSRADALGRVPED